MWSVTQGNGFCVWSKKEILGSSRGLDQGQSPITTGPVHSPHLWGLLQALCALCPCFLLRPAAAWIRALRTLLFLSLIKSRFSVLQVLLIQLALTSSWSKKTWNPNPCPWAPSQHWESVWKASGHPYRQTPICPGFFPWSHRLMDKEPQCYLMARLVKEPTCQCRRYRRYGFDPWVRKIPWRRAWQPTPGFLPGKLHGQRSLAGDRQPMGSQGVGHDWATKQWQHVLQESSYPKHKGALSLI